MKINVKLDLARRVLQLSEFCRKLETIQELVLPFEVQVEETSNTNQNQRKDGDEPKNIVDGENVDDNGESGEGELDDNMDSLLEQKPTDKSNAAQEAGVNAVLQLFGMMMKIIMSHLLKD